MKIILLQLFFFVVVILEFSAFFAIKYLFRLVSQVLLACILLVPELNSTHPICSMPKGVCPTLVSICIQKMDAAEFLDYTKPEAEAG